MGFRTCVHATRLPVQRAVLRVIDARASGLRLGWHLGQNEWYPKNCTIWVSPYVAPSDQQLNENENVKVIGFIKLVPSSADCRLKVFPDVALRLLNLVHSWRDWNRLIYV